jgi:hypothetical protein
MQLKSVMCWNFFSQRSAKKAKKTAVSRDTNASAVGIWDQTKFTAKDLHKLFKEDFMKEGSNELKMPGHKTTPAPLAG